MQADPAPVGRTRAASTRAHVRAFARAGGVQQRRRRRRRRERGSSRASGLLLAAGSARTAPQALHCSSMSSFLVTTMSVSGLPHCPHWTNFLMNPSSSPDSLCVSCAPFTMDRPDASSNLVCAPSSQPKNLVVSASAGSACHFSRFSLAAAGAAAVRGGRGWARTGGRPPQRLRDVDHVHHVRFDAVAAPLDLLPAAGRGQHA